MQGLEEDYTKARGPMSYRPHLECGFQKGWETGPPVSSPETWGSLVAGEPYPHPRSLLALTWSFLQTLWNTQRGFLVLKGHWQLTPCRNQRTGGERVVLEEVQRKAFCKQAPTFLGHHRRHFPPTARTLEKELRRKLEIKLRPSPL